MKAPNDISQKTLLELFREEVETQTALLTTGLLELERRPASPPQLEALMRAAHSLKGAARIVGLTPAIRVAHGMEDCFVAAQRGQFRLGPAEVDALFRGVDLLQQLGCRAGPDREMWVQTNARSLEECVHQLRALASQAGSPPARRAEDGAPATADGTPAAGCQLLPQDSTSPRPDGTLQPVAPMTLHWDGMPMPPPAERVLRLAADQLNRLLGLASESLVETRWLSPFTANLQRLRRDQVDLETRLARLANTLRDAAPGLGHSTSGVRLLSPASPALRQLEDMAAHLRHCRACLDEQVAELDQQERRSGQHARRLYLEVLRTRLRPFSDGVRSFPRMVRELARALGKEVRLEISGEQTSVDRELLEQLETPLAHLLRNAVDHGCEPPTVRQQRGKPPVATLHLEARHCAGQLQIIVADDGAGVDLEAVRAAVSRQGLAVARAGDRETAGSVSIARLAEAELLEYLFLPGFTLKPEVTELSGRGVGLDLVRNRVKSLRGRVRVSTLAGQGTRFELQLPLTHSVVRVLLVEIGGEPYALPLGSLDCVLRVPRTEVETVAGQPQIRRQAEALGLVAAQALFVTGGPGQETNEALGARCGGVKTAGRAGHRTLDTVGDTLSVVVLGEGARQFGLVVDRFLGESELIVQPLDPRLGKVHDISAAAVLADGTPVLIVDTDDLVRSVEKHVARGFPSRPGLGEPEVAPRRRKRVLAVEDTPTVRELERQLLLGGGYAVEVAVDGVDGWNAVRTGEFDLVITDVDMPRLDGIALTRLIRQDSRLESLPVMIVSYKDRAEDRLRGLEAGADYYLTKSDFHDQKLLQAVADLIGEATE